MYTIYVVANTNKELKTKVGKKDKKLLTYSMTKQEYSSKIIAVLIEKIPDLNSVRTILEERFNSFQKEDLKEILEAVTPKKEETT